MIELECCAAVSFINKIKPATDAMEANNEIQKIALQEVISIMTAPITGLRATDSSTAAPIMAIILTAFLLV